MKNGKADGKERIDAVEIEELYLPVSNLKKGMCAADFFSKVSSMKTKDIRATVEKQDSYYKSVKVLIKNKKFEDTYLLQQLNPEFNKFIQVYADPTASETGGFFISGFLS